jgi:glycosyltransferase involved in cell wall biosynthesis
MKILIVTGIYPPDIGGSATYSALLARELPARGFEVLILTYGNPHFNPPPASRGRKPASFPPPSVEGGGVGGGLLYYVSTRWPKGIRHIVFLYKLIFLAAKSDVVLVADSSFGAATIAAIACRLLGKKFIIRVTGDYAWEQGVQRFGVKDLIDEFQKKKYGFFVQALRYAQRFAVKTATVIIAPSEYLRRLTIGWGALPEKVVVINNAVDLPHLNPPPASRGRKPASFPPPSVEGGGVGGGSSFVVISSGRLVPWKGFDVLIDAVSELQKDIPEIKLVIVGSGPEKQKILSSLSQRGRSEVGVLIDSLPKSELAKKISESDVFVLNTAYEGFSHQIVEALSLGVPVIATNVGGNPEIIKDGENGLLVGYNDKEAIKNAILRLYKNRDLAACLGQKGAEDAKKHSKEAMLDKLIAVL